MKFQFSSPTYTSAFEQAVGQDFMSSTGESLTDQAWIRGWRFNPTDSIDRHYQLQRAHDLATMDTEQLQRSYLGGMYGRRPEDFQDPEGAFLYDNMAQSVPTLQEFRNRGFQDEEIRRMSAEEANAQYGIPGQLQFQEPISNLEAWILNDRKIQEIKFNYVLDKAQGGDWWKGTGIEMGAALLDPIGLVASIAMPVIGAETLLARLGLATTARAATSFGERTAVRAITGGLGGLQGAALVEPLIYGAAQEEQADYTMMQSLANIAFGGIAGGGLHIVGGSVVDGFRGIRQGRHVQSLHTAIKQMAAGQTPEVQPIAHGGSLPEAAQAPKKVSFDGDTFVDENSPVKPGAVETGGDVTVARAGTPEAEASPVVEHTPHQNAEQSMALMDQKEKFGAPAWTNLWMGHLFNKVQPLREALVETLKQGSKNKFAFRIQTKDGKIVLIRAAEGQPLQLFDTTEISTISQTGQIDMAKFGASVYQALQMHGLDVSTGALDYHGSFKVEDGVIHHVIDINNVDFDPKMNQKHTVLAEPSEAPHALAGTPWAQTFSGLTPKGMEGVKTHFQEEGHFVDDNFKQDADGITVWDGLDQAYNAENLKQTAEGKGTQKGGFYDDMSTGQQVYAKFPDNPDVAVNEFIAATLYRMLGVDMPESRLVMKDGKVVGVASKVEPNIKTLSPEEFVKLPVEAREAFVKDAIVDMFLGNWDVVGNAPNYNIFLREDGSVGRLDPGGALLFRAQGGTKSLDDLISEFKTMRDPKKNPTAAKVFNSVDNFEQLQQEAALRIMALDEGDLQKLINDMAGFAKGQELFNSLQARLQTLYSMTLGVDAKGNPAKLSNLGKDVVKTKSHYLFFSKGEALDHIKRYAKALFDKYTSEEKMVVSSYGGSGYSAINDFLRLSPDQQAKHPNRKALQERADLLASAVGKSTIQNNTIVFRGGVPSHIFDGINGQKLANFKDVQSAKAMIGGTITTSGFSSTSLSKPFSLKWGNTQTPLLQIRIPKGYNALYGDPKMMGLSASEVEIVIPHNATFQIKNALELPNGRIEFILDVLPPDWKPTPLVNKKMAIQMAEVYKEQAPNGVADVQDPLDFESNTAVHEMLKPDQGILKNVPDMDKEIEGILSEIEAYTANLDPKIAEEFKTMKEAIDGQFKIDNEMAEAMYKAAQAAAVCVKGAG